jgi:hypothetical protein
MVVIVGQIFVVYPHVIFLVFLRQSPRHRLIPLVSCTCIIIVSTGQYGCLIILQFAVEAMEFPVQRHEWSSRPIGLLKPAYHCPVVRIPNVGEHAHPLLSREYIMCSLSVPMDSHQNLVYE